MKVAIVVFSPSGNTLKTATMLRDELVLRGIAVQLVDLTGNKQVVNNDGLAAFLEKIIPAHDLLCIGGPVYAHHLHYNVKRLIKSLPKPGGKWGNLAVPFVTYGTISSGISLREAAFLLHKTGRITVCGLKIAAFHCISRLLSTKVGEGLPGEESLPVVAELADRLCRLGEKPLIAAVKPQTLDFQSRLNKLKAQLLFREKLWQRHIYPRLALDMAKCHLCGICTKACPVQRLKLKGEKLTITKKPACIHCGQCINNCPAKALSFKADLQKWDELLTKAANGHGLMPSHEAPKSAVYPLKEQF